MAILRPVAQEAAEKAAKLFRESVDFMLLAIEDTIADDFCFPAKHMPVNKPVFVPCREGRSLYQFVKRRSFRKRQYAGRLSGHNAGENVTYED